MDDGIPFGVIVIAIIASSLTAGIVRGYDIAKEKEAAKVAVVEQVKK